MSYREEYPRQLAARFRNAARDLLDHVAHADREQKRQLVRHAFKLVQTAEALQPFAVEDERAAVRRSERSPTTTPAIRGDSGVKSIPEAPILEPIPSMRSAQVVGSSRRRSGAKAFQLASGHCAH